MTRRVTRWIQVAVSVLLLWLVFVNVDDREALAALARLSPVTVALAIALSLAAYVFRAARWTMLLRRAGLSLSGWTSFRLTLLGVLYGVVTPGRVGELARVLHLNLPRARALPSTIWDRVADVLLLEAMALPGFILVPAWRGPVFWAYGVVVAATLVVAIVLDSRRAMEWIERRAPARWRFVAQWRSGATDMLTTPAFHRALLAGLAYYVLTFAGAWFLLRELEPGAPAILALSFPIIPLLGNLPIAFGGLGLREQVSASLFRSVGAVAAAGPVFSLVWFGVATLVPGLVGLALSYGPWARDPGPAGVTPGEQAPAAGGSP
jgi:hypothetical protein